MSLQDAATRASSSRLQTLGLALLVGGLLGRVLGGVVGLLAFVPWSLVSFTGAVMLFVAVRRRR